MRYDKNGSGGERHELLWENKNLSKTNKLRKTMRRPNLAQKRKKKNKAPIPGVEPGSLPATSMRGQYDNRYTIWDCFSILVVPT